MLPPIGFNLPIFNTQINNIHLKDIYDLFKNNISSISNQTIEFKIQNTEQFRKDVCNFMLDLNKNPNILYINDYGKKFGALDVSSYEKQIFTTTGFQYKPGKYEYTGEKPAEALEKLLKSKPLLLECRQVLDLCYILAFKKQIENESFDLFIKDKCGGSLAFNAEIIDKLNLNFEEVIQYKSKINAECNQINQLNQIKVGDFIYIAMPNGFALHPTSTLNGYNLICVGFNENEKALFLGFDTAAQKPYTIDEISAKLEKEFKLNFSYYDLVNIYKNKDNRSNNIDSTLSYAEVYAYLKSNQDFNVEYVKAAHIFESNNFKEIYEPCSIPIPSEYLNTKCTLFKVMHLFKQKTTQLRHFDSIEDSKYDNLIAGYTASSPSQKNFVRALRQFASFSQQNEFIATYVFGPAGVGKTACSLKIIKSLEENGKKVLKIDVDNINMFSIITPFINANINIGNKSVNKEKVISSITENFKDDWEQYEVFFVDGISNDFLSENAYLAMALIEYAKENNKQILMNSNFDPIETNILDETEFFSNIVCVQVDGEDYRKLLPHWWKLDADITKQQADIIIENFKQHFFKHNKNQPSIQQNALASNIQLDFAKLNSSVESGVICVFGKPGVGKTSVLKSLLTVLNKPFLWLNIKDFDKNFSFSQSDQEIFVFDDLNFEINDTNDSRVLFKLIYNSENLKNKNNRPIKIILISNEKEFTPSKIFGRYNGEELLPRIESRLPALTKFYDTNLALTKNFRFLADKRGACVSDISESQIRKKHNLEAMDTILNININYIISFFEGNVKNNEFELNKEFKETIISGIKTAKAVIIKFNDAPFTHFRLHESILMTLLDEMEENNLPLYFVPLKDNPQNALQNLIKCFKDDDLIKPVMEGKYISRLRRIEAE